jgi:hypothetical protein
MMDLITSKLAMMIAAVIILSTVLGVYAIQREQGRDLELMNIAGTICRAVDEMNTIQGDTIFNMTFDRGAQGRFIEPLVNGKNYNILITRYEVVISQDNKRCQEDFMAPVHLWKPDLNSFTISEIEDSHGEFNELIFTSGTDFTLERKSVLVGEELEFITFVYL